MPIVLHSVGPRPKVPAAVAAGTDGRYRLQQQLVPLAWTDGPFSSSDRKLYFLDTPMYFFLFPGLLLFLLLRNDPNH